MPTTLDQAVGPLLLHGHRQQPLDRSADSRAARRLGHPHPGRRRRAVRPHKRRTVVIVFPSYLAGLHGVPLIVERFLGKLEDAQSKRVFAICNCGGHEIVNAVPCTRNFRRVARSLGIRLAAEYTVGLPMNNLDFEHIPVPIETDSAKIIAHAEEQIADICERIERGRQGRNYLGRELANIAK